MCRVVLARDRSPGRDAGDAVLVDLQPDEPSDANGDGLLFPGVLEFDAACPTAGAVIVTGKAVIVAQARAPSGVNITGSR
ncbi:hypothetical protein BH24CHL9_BH24CHL9_06810 [soil metagenome]